MKKSSSKRITAVLTAVILLVLCALPLTANAAGSVRITELIPGGMAFGVKFFTEGVIVLGTTGVETASGLCSPAKDAGLNSGDIIIRAGGKEFETASELTLIISGCAGRSVVLDLIRDEREISLEVTPVRELESGEYRIGVLVRDSTAGIGTVTFIDPETLDFGGLGHGIYDSETALLLPLKSGTIVDVDISSVEKSRKNSPGELHGEFSDAAEGELWANTDQGVFGRYFKMPYDVGKALPVSSRAELTAGKAKMLTTLNDGEVKAYDIEIERVYSASGSTKNFLLRVTDKTLIEKAGGIVQGMSGSPIIKDGKLIGAVTHVLVNDPIHGYGICIENMLDSAFDTECA